MIDRLRLDRRALLASMAAAPVPRAAWASPKDYPAVQAFLNDYVGAKKVANCVVGVKRDTRPVEFLSAGTIALDSAIPADADSLYRIYSMTKPITGIAFMKLVEHGVLKLEQPISDILPEFAEPRVMIDGSLENTRPAASPILMRHLVTHTSGLSYSLHNKTVLGQAYQAYGLTPAGREVAAGLARPTDKFPPARDLETFGRRLALLPLDFDPGTQWNYAVGLDLMGLIVQRASGMPFEDFLRTEIFAPLKMNDTDFVVPRTRTSRLTGYYARRDGQLVTLDDRRTSAYLRDRDLPSGGGGLVSTARDYMRFTTMLLNEGAVDGVRVLRPETVRIARSSMMDPGVFTRSFGGVGNTFGAGMQILSKPSSAGEPAGTFAWDGAAGTQMWVDPVNRIAVCGMVQIQGASIRQALREAIYQDIGVRPAHTRAAAPDAGAPQPAPAPQAPPARGRVRRPAGALLRRMR
jgi:CubicO group peptidase (beta-lactamase class C family)